MANELRTRTNFVGGLVEDNPLTNVATTLTSAGLAALPVIDTTNHAALILDPDGIHGAPEIVWVTAHSASSTTATILRAQESTSSRQHLRDTYWVHTATVRDFAPEAPYIAYGDGSGDQTTNSTTLSDIPNVGTVSVPASVGDRLICSFSCAIYTGGGAAAGIMRFNLGGINGREHLPFTGSGSSCSNFIRETRVVTSPMISSGSVIVKMQWRRISAQLYIENDATFGLPELHVAGVGP